MLRLGVGGNDVEKVGGTSGQILATPLRVQFRNGEKRWFFVPKGSVITHRTSFDFVEDTPKFVRIEVGFIEFQGNEWKVRFLGGDSVDRFQNTSTTELYCEP